VGCFRSRLPPLEQYRLSTASENAAGTSLDKGPLAGSIAISPFITPGVYGGDEIVYRIGDTEYGTYPNREWALPLGDMLGMLAEETIRENPLGNVGVYDPESRRQFDFLWQGAVREFEEVNRGNRVFAAVRLEARLLRSNDDSIIWRGDRSVERPVADPTMTRIVEELSAAAREAMRALVSEAKTAASKLSARTAPP